MKGANGRRYTTKAFTETSTRRGPVAVHFHTTHGITQFKRRVEPSLRETAGSARTTKGAKEAEEGKGEGGEGK